MAGVARPYAIIGRYGMGDAPAAAGHCASTRHATGADHLLVLQRLSTARSCSRRVPGMTVAGG